MIARCIISLFLFVTFVSEGMGQKKITLHQLLRSDSTIAHPRLRQIFPPTEKKVSRHYPTRQEFSPPTSPRVVLLKNMAAEISPNVQIHPDTLITQSEMSIQVHPDDSNILLAGANAVDPIRLKGSIGWYFSIDGGTTWEGSDTLAMHTDLERSLTDPAVAISREGMFVVNAVYLAESSDIILVRSSDKGRNWEQTAVQYSSNSEDKNHCVVDVSPGSPFIGAIYAAFTDFDPNLSVPSPIMFSRSEDNGRNFSPPQSISDGVGTLFAQGVNLATGLDGEVYAAWSGYDDWPPPVQTRLGFNKSYDGGRTWIGAQSIRTINDIRGLLYKGTYSIRVNSFPSLAVDGSNGERRGWLYLVYAERQLTRTIYLLKSTDKGDTWSEPKKVPQDNSVNDHWLPWATVDPATGFLYVVYYDSRNFRNNDSAQVYISVSIDGGETFEDILVSDQAFLPKPIQGLASGYMGDYIGVAASNGIVWPCWNDDRTGMHQAYTSRIRIVNIGQPPTLTVTPGVLDFGTVYIGFPDTLDLELHNTGFPDPLHVTDIYVDNEAIVPDVRSFQLRSGELKVVHIIGNPETTSVISGHITILSSDSLRPSIQIPVSAVSLYPPLATVYPQSFRDTVAVGDSGVVTFQVKNSGHSELRFSVTPSRSWIYALPNNGVVEPGESVSVELRFTTQEFIGSLYSVSILVVTNDPAHPQFILPFTLRVRGVPHIRATLDTLFFGDVALGFLTSMPVFLNNTGTDTLIVNRWTISDDQFFIDGPAQFTIPPRSSRKLLVQFLPIELSVITAGLSIESNDEEIPVMGVTLRGEGVPPPAVVFSSDTIKFTLYRGDTASVQLYLGNNGPGILRWSLEINTDNNITADWLIVAPTEGIIEPRRNSVIAVNVVTRNTLHGTYRTNIVVHCNDPARQTITVPVELTILQIPNLRLSASSLNFQNTFIGYPDTEAVTVTNAGALNVHITSITSNSTYFQIIDFSEQTLHSRESVELKIRFSPETVGEVRGIITIESDDPIAYFLQLRVLGTGHYPPLLSLQNAILTPRLHYSGDTSEHIISMTNQGGYELQIEMHTVPFPHDSGDGRIGIIEGSTAPDSVFLPYLFLDGAGYRWDIEDNGRVGDGTNDAFDGGMELQHFPRRPTARLQFEERELVLGPVPFGSVQLERRIFVPANEGFVRYLEIISNKTNIAQTIVLTFNSNLGADQEVKYVLTSSGDEELSPDDTWIITDDEENANDPAVVHVFAGLGDVKRPTAIIGGRQKGIVSYVFSFHIPPNESRSLLHFAAQRFSRDDARDITRALVNGEHHALEGINERLRRSVQNFNLFSFLSVVPKEIHILPGMAANVYVRFSASALSSGEYRSSLVLVSNDPALPVVTIPAHLTVNGAPHVSFETSLVNFNNIYVGYPDTVIVRMSNSGSDTLRVESIFTDEQSFTYLGKTQFSLAPQAYRDLRVVFLPTSPQSYSSTLTIITNDPTGNPANMTLRGNGISVPSFAIHPDSFSYIVSEKESLSAAMVLHNKEIVPQEFVIRSLTSGTEFFVKGSTQATTQARVRGNVYAITKSTTLIEFKTYLSLFTPATMDFVVYEANSLTGSFYQVFKSSRTETDVGQKLYSSGSIGLRMKAKYYYYLATALRTLERFYILPDTMPTRTTFGALHFGAELRGYPAPLILPSIVPANYMYYQSVITGEFSFIPAIDPRAGVVPPQDSVEIVLSSKSLIPGEYHSVIMISSQNPDQALFSFPIDLTVIPTGGTNRNELPVELKVEQNYPNPFNPKTIIRYATKTESVNRVVVYNVLGQKVDEQVIGTQPAGKHEIVWNSDGFASGVYFYTVTAVSVQSPQTVHRETRKMVVMR